MMKKLISALLTVCLLAGGCMTAYAYEDENLPHVSTLEELEAYILSGIVNEEKELNFSYSAELDELFSTREGINYLLEGYGVRNWYYSRRTVYRTARLRINSLKPGARVAFAYLEGSTDGLTDEEKQLYAVAEEIVREALSRTNDPLELEKYFHDEICRRVVYTLSGYQHYSPNYATGALLYGEAECDGYADAFYMLCSMAELKVRCISGLSDASDPKSRHTWNLIELDDGLMYHVDVCWDDEGDSAAYTYFNVGSSDLSLRSWADTQFSLSDAAY